MCLRYCFAGPCGVPDGAKHVIQTQLPRTSNPDAVVGVGSGYCLSSVQQNSVVFYRAGNITIIAVQFVLGQVIESLLYEMGRVQLIDVRYQRPQPIGAIRSCAKRKEFKIENVCEDLRRYVRSAGGQEPASLQLSFCVFMAFGHGQDHRVP